jgi:hypothetical protein
MKTRFTRRFCRWKFLFAVELCFVTALSAVAADHHDRDKDQRNLSHDQKVNQRHEQERRSNVDRFSHGSVRNSNRYILRQPAPDRHVDVRHENVVRHENIVRRDVHVHHDVDVDYHRPRHWDNFVFGLRLPKLPFGFLSLRIGGNPYYYNDGIYYQPYEGGYREVYPPVGAVIPQPPPGSVEIYAGNQVYYYAGGGFYVQQPDGSYVLAPTPIGVVVPELPPGAVEVSVQGRIAYQFNGIYYQPVFVNGITQFQTFVP